MPDDPNATIPPKTETTADLPILLPVRELTVTHKLVPATVSPPPKRWSWQLWAFLALFVTVGSGLWYFQPWIPKGLPVIIETIVPATLTRVLAVNGRVAPLHLINVKASVGGKVTNVLVEEGQNVAQGDILARIDASSQQALVRQAAAGLDAGLVAQEQAATNSARAEALGNNISRTALADARSAQQTAMQEVARLTALLDQAQIKFEEFTVVSPVAGTVLSRHAETGQSVDLTMPLFSIADLGQLIVETNVDESYAALMTPGLAAVLQLKGAADTRKGSVSFVAAQVDAATGGLEVRIAFDDPVVAPVGLTVTANIIVDRQNDAIAVPRAALGTDAKGSFIFVAVAGQAQHREVVVVDWPADRVQVSEGLSAGEVIISDATGVSDGLAITLPAEAVPVP